MICGKTAQAQSTPFHTHMVLGLTGGMGCGKSTASQLFESFGFQRVDSDALVRSVVLADASVIGQIRARFGDEVVDTDGQIVRAVLARHVFADAQELLWLEDLIHPRLFAEWRRILGEKGTHNVVFEVPLLFEKALENWFDFTLCVATSSAHQLARLRERGMSHALAEQRISKQLPLVQKIESADYVLLNDGSVTFLRDQIATLVADLSARR